MSSNPMGGDGGHSPGLKPPSVSIILFFMGFLAEVKCSGSYLNCSCCFSTGECEIFLSFLSSSIL